MIDIVLIEVQEVKQRQPIHCHGLVLLEFSLSCLVFTHNRVFNQNTSLNSSFLLVRIS